MSNIAHDFMSSRRYPSALRSITFFTFDDPQFKRKFMREVVVAWSDEVKAILTEEDTGYSFDQLLVNGQNLVAEGIAEMPYVSNLKVVLLKDSEDKHRINTEDVQSFENDEQAALGLVMAVRYFVSRVKTNVRADPWLFLYPQQWLKKSRKFHPWTKAAAEVWITCWLLLRFGFDPYSKGVLRLGSFLVQYALESEFASDTELHIATVHFILVFRTVQWLIHEPKEIGRVESFNMKVNAMSRCTYLTWVHGKDFAQLWRYTQKDLNDMMIMHIPAQRRFWVDPGSNFVLLPLTSAGLYGDWSRKMYLQVWMGHIQAPWPAVYVPKVVALLYWITISITAWKGDDRKITDADTGIKLLTQSEFELHITRAWRRLEFKLSLWYERVLEDLHDRRRLTGRVSTMHGSEGLQFSYYFRQTFSKLMTYWFQGYSPAQYFPPVYPQLVYLNTWVPLAPKLPTHLVIVPPRSQIGSDWKRFRNFYRQPRLIPDDRRHFQQYWHRFYWAVLSSEKMYDERDLAVTLAYLQAKLYNDENVEAYRDGMWSSSLDWTDKSLQRAFFQPLEPRRFGWQSRKEYVMQVDFERAQVKHQITDFPFNILKAFRFFGAQTRVTGTSVGISRTLIVSRPGPMIGLDVAPRNFNYHIKEDMQQAMVLPDEVNLPVVEIEFSPDKEEIELDDWFNEDFTQVWQAIFYMAFMGITNRSQLREQDYERIRQQVAGEVEDSESSEVDGAAQLEFIAQNLELQADEDARQITREQRFDMLRNIFGHVSFRVEPYTSVNARGQLLQGHLVFFRTDANLLPNEVGLLHVSFAAQGQEALSRKLKLWQAEWRKYMWIKFKQYYRDEVYEIDPDEESKRLVHDVWNRINPDWDISNMHESIWSYGNAADMY